MSSLSNQYLKIRDKIGVIEKRLAEKEEEYKTNIQTETAELSKLKDEEVDVKLSLIDEMEEKDAKTIEIGNRLITKQSKTTIQIDNEEKFVKDIEDNNGEYKQILITKKIGNLMDYLMPRTPAKKNITDLAEKVKSLNGKLPNGITENETKYLTVRNIEVKQ